MERDPHLEPPPPPPLRVAVWGLGRHAERRLLPALVECRATTLAGLTTRDADRGTQIAAVHGCTYWRRPEEMLESDAVDAVIVATPIGCHAAHGRAVLEAGKDLWCEKSLTPSAGEAEDLIAEARRREVVLAECFMFLYHPQFRQIQARFAQLGAVVSLTCRFFMPRLDQPGFRHSAALGGGALLDVGCYPLRMAAALLGDDLAVRDTRLVTPPDVEVDMMGHAVLETASGAVAFLEWGFGAAYRNELTICGDTGSIEADRVFSKTSEQETQLVVRDLRGEQRNEPVERADSFVAMFSAIADAHRDRFLREQLYADAGAQARLIQSVRVASTRA